MDNNSRPVVKVERVISYAGAFIALLIGSGFATGQELMQYFVSYGYGGVLGALFCFVLFSYVGVSFINAGYREKFKNTNDIYRYYAGEKIGTFYDYFSIFFIFLSYTVMIGGASATAEQHYGWSPMAGGLLMAVLTIATVIFGLKGIVDVIGKIGPVIVVLSIVVGTVGMIKYSGYSSTAPADVMALVEKKEVLRAGPNWLMAALSYIGFCMLWLAAFMAGIGKNANSEKEGTLGAIGGAFGFSLAVLIMSLGLLFAIKIVGGSSIPNLLLAGSIHPTLANIFSVVIMLGIYTTSVPLMWSVVARFFEEGTAKFKIATVILVIIGAFIGLMLDFKKLVNIVYALNGYVGIILLIFIIIKSIRTKKI